MKQEFLWNLWRNSSAPHVPPHPPTHIHWNLVQNLHQLKYLGRDKSNLVLSGSRGGGGNGLQIDFWRRSHRFSKQIGWCRIGWRGRWAKGKSPDWCQSFLFAFFFNWSIVDLRYCVSFRWTAKWFSYIYVCVCKSTQLCPTLFDPMDYRSPGTSVHGLLQARIQEWVAIPFSMGSSQPRDRPQVSCIAGRFFTVWATREAHMCIFWCICIFILFQDSFPL